MKDDLAYLKHMLEAIEEIRSFVKDSRDRKTLRAVERDIQIIGEAARHISPVLQKRHPQVPWKDIAGMRHKIVHDYFGVDPDLVWDVVKNDLPVLEEQLLSVLQREM